VFGSIFRKRGEGEEGEQNPSSIELTVIKKCSIILLNQKWFKIETASLFLVQN
jgi:hypothetical protein